MHKKLLCAALLQGLLLICVSASLDDCQVEVTVVSTAPSGKGLPGNPAFEPSASQECIEFNLDVPSMISGVSANSASPYDIQFSFLGSTWSDFGSKNPTGNGGFSLSLELASSLRICAQAAISDVKFTKCAGLK
ncbi:uncharacterized protein LOC135471553 [Liolophura sinensis]|uniref:uncharacterized protein LOC135471553 n=1 Tax=Liolophura sinensis TaxID=3198878 RepID=UPI0031588A10